MRNPLLERVKFLAITASNLDEFVEIRVAGVLQRIEDGYIEPGFDGLTPRQTLDARGQRHANFVRDQYRCWNQSLRPALSDNGVRVLAWAKSTQAARLSLDYYQREVDPLLTPITIDPAHPFPRVINKALCLALLLRRNARRHRRVTGRGHRAPGPAAPRRSPRQRRHPRLHFSRTTSSSTTPCGMYRGYEILSTAAFRVTRNSNLYFQEEESRNLLETVRSELHNRRKGDAVRLEIEEGAEAEIVERLRRISNSTSGRSSAPMAPSTFRVS